MIPRLSITRILFILLVIYPFIVSASLLVPISSTLTKHHKSCSDIETHPDQCAFVMNTCHGFSGVFLRFYYCSTLWKPLSVTIMLSGLLLLFGAVSVVAADFFCPNLQTISSRLQLSESMAGVTVLAFGNGSPDLFSTFTAMNSGSGSLAVGELIGAAFFIVSVVSGCMGIIRPFRSKKITFMRDASFLTGAIMILTWIVYHQRICWYHGILLILYYITYVIVVVLGAYRGEDSEDEDLEVVVPVSINEPKSSGMEHCNTQELLTETSRLLRLSPSVNGPLRLEIPAYGFQSQEHLGHIIRPVSPNSSHLSRRSSLHIDSYFPRTTSTNGSISSRLYRHAMSPRVGIRTSLFSAIEFQEQVATIKRANSTQLYHPPMTQTRTAELRKRHTQASVPCISSARTRQESADHLLTINHMHNQQPQRQHHLITTPENNTNGNMDDYFTYISNSHHQQQQQQQQSSNIEEEANRQPTPIPQITLDPAVTSPIKQQFDCNEQEAEEEEEAEDDHASSLHVPLLSSANSTKQHQIDEEQQLLKESVSLSMILDDICCTLFPTLSDWSQKTTFARLSALVAVPLVLVFTLTLPIAEGEDVKVDDIEVTAAAAQQEEEEEVDVSTTPQVVVITSGDVQEAAATATATAGTTANTKNYLTVPTSERSLNDLVVVAEEENPLLLMDDQVVSIGWCRWLTAVQAICSTTFVTSVMALNGFIPTCGILVGTLVGCALAILVTLKSKVNEAPKWHWMLSFVGFVIALNWIFLLANEMVGLLQALGTIFDISEAIMGLTIFALGNSVGDLVANTAIAKMGFPTMAISACYAGPLLNMVLGVGISSTYQTWITGKPYQLDIAPTILISSFGLITVLLSTLIVVNINGYHINRQLGWWMIIVYSTCTMINLLLEFHLFF